jgi:hypothetical protein
MPVSLGPASLPAIFVLKTLRAETEFYDLSEKLTASPDFPFANAREIAGSSKPV